VRQVGQLPRIIYNIYILKHTASLTARPQT